MDAPNPTIPDLELPDGDGEVGELSRGMYVEPSDWESNVLHIHGRCCGCDWHYERDQVVALRDWLSDLLEKTQ